MADTDRDRRPSADALLALTQRSQRGRLKVFVGAAPGVGKTYAMLQAARARKAQGTDVVAAVVETHRRAETQALLDGLEVVPRREIDYRGTRLSEMDLDAVLARRPQLVLVDELAHTNAPGCRHPKRYLDVDELLAAGIDVYTTVNIQHLDSLNDTVAQITGIRVRETLPDRVLETADDVQLIDLPPEELIQRLHEGKVYVPDQAARAIQNYFRPGNLNALRELVLRRTADRVDVQMQDWMRAEAVAGPWPTKDRIMVCVSPSPTSDKLVRATKRRAARRNAEWLAVYIETPAHEQMSEAEQGRLTRTLRLAEQLGGEAVTMPGRKPADDLIHYARSRNVTEIIIGKSMRSWWQELRYGSLVGDLIRKSGTIDVYVIHGDDEADTARPQSHRGAHSEAKPGNYVVATGVVAVTALLTKLVQQGLSLPNLSIIFLLSVVFCAVRYGVWVSLYACVISALAYNFLFIAPLYTFTIASPQETLAFGVFFVVAVIVSHITARMQEQAEAARRREARTNALFKLSRAIAAATDPDETARTVVTQVADILQAKAVVLLPGPRGVRLVASAPADTQLDEHERAAAAWSATHALPTGNGTDTLPGVAWSFLPMSAGQRTIGVMGLFFDATGDLIPPRRWRLMEALADQAAVGLERAGLRRDMEQSRLASEADKLYAALLSSISHDLRTPLASVIGACSSLIEFGSEYDEQTRDDLLHTIHEEAERLNRFIGNLLDVTRLESGRLEPHRDWVQVDEVIASAVARLKSVLAHHRLHLQVAPQLPLIRLDFVLMEQVLVNLLDNAARYSPPDTVVTLSAGCDERNIVIEIRDEGVGVPQDELEQIFDKFHRVRVADRQVAGTGLGLSICRGIVEAHGGTIRAGLAPGRKGLVLTIRLPLETPPPAPVLDQVSRG